LKEIQDFPGLLDFILVKSYLGDGVSSKEKVFHRKPP
jgi:hypothetical protein